MRLSAHLICPCISATCVPFQLQCCFTPTQTPICESPSSEEIILNRCPLAGIFSSLCWGTGALHWYLPMSSQDFVIGEPGVLSPCTAGSPLRLWFMPRIRLPSPSVEKCVSYLNSLLINLTDDAQFLIILFFFAVFVLSFISIMLGDS